MILTTENASIIIIKTENGSTYEIFTKDGRVCFRKGYNLSGEIVEFKEKLCIGGKLNIKFHKDFLYGGQERGIMFLKTTPIVEITIG